MSSRDGRLAPYGLIAMVGLATSLFGGEPALAVLAVPFLLALALGLRQTGAVEVTARLSFDSDQALEGDLITGRLELAWSGVFDAEVMLHRLEGVESVAPGTTSWSLPDARRSLDLPIHLRAAQWGSHTPCEVWVRLQFPFGLLSWTGRVVAGPTVRVLPGSERLNRMFDPSTSRGVFGLHRSKRVGDGSEFAQMRPYVPGDRLRDLNWAATARYGRPIVNRYHPELSGDVVIALDAFADGSLASTEALRRAARAAWALASIHFRANDRVGLAGLGGRTQWLPPAGGRLARYRFLEVLLQIGGEAGRSAKIRAGQCRAVPSSALVIALTPLHDDHPLHALTSWRAQGRSVAVVLIDMNDLLDEPVSEAEDLARRLWLLELDRRKRELTRLGIPLVTLGSDDPMNPLVSALRRARRAPFPRRMR